MPAMNMTRLLLLAVLVAMSLFATSAAVTGTGTVAALESELRLENARAFPMTQNDVAEPSTQPTAKPSSVPTQQSAQPTAEPTAEPSSVPTQPSASPSAQPSAEPTTVLTQPSAQPTAEPSSVPTQQSAHPSAEPSAEPSSVLTQPSAQPTAEPSTVLTQPSAQPTAEPTAEPSSVPTQPSAQPSASPSAQPTAEPSSVLTQPSAQPTAEPSSVLTQPSAQPSAQPTAEPSSVPTQPSASPSAQPSAEPTAEPSSVPTQPSVQPSSQPTAEPSSVPSVEFPVIATPTAQPSAQPSQPSSEPSTQPSNQPTVEPSVFELLSINPSSIPTLTPTFPPSADPSQEPTPAPSHHPTPRPSPRPTRFPTPHPKAGTTWWYSTQAYLMVSWHPDQEQLPDQGPDDLAPSLDHAFYLALQELLDWDSLGMSTLVVVGSKDIFTSDYSGLRVHNRQVTGAMSARGLRANVPSAFNGLMTRLGLRALTDHYSGRRLKQAQWDSFTLGVWTTADGSLGEVAAALQHLMKNQSIVIDLMAEGDHSTVDEFIIHEVTPGVTTTPPPGVDAPAQDAASIALIIMWTVVIFVVGVVIISCIKSRCSKKQDPFTYRAPSESLFNKMTNRSSQQQRGGGMGMQNKFGLLSGEMEMSDGKTSNPMNSGAHDFISY